MPEYRRNNGKLEVWDIVKTFNEDEVKIVHHCKDFVIPKWMDVFVCTCGRELRVDSKGNILDIN